MAHLWPKNIHHPNVMIQVRKKMEDLFRSTSCIKEIDYIVQSLTYIYRYLSMSTFEKFLFISEEIFFALFCVLISYVCTCF